MTDRARTRDTGTWPAPGETRFTFELIDRDGDPCVRFSPDGPVELVLSASEQPVDAAGADGRLFVVLPLAFPNYPIARQHAEAIALVLRLLQNTLTDAMEHRNDPIPTRDDGHRHVVRLARYARALPFRAECELCMCELVEDVAAWARDRGLVHPDTSEQFSRTLPVEDPATVRDAIEQAVNRDG